MVRGYDVVLMIRSKSDINFPSMISDKFRPPAGDGRSRDHDWSVSGLITERGVLQAERQALAQAFPERAANHQ